MPIDGEQFEQQRTRLFAIAYRMLGSVSDAEDAVQDAYVRARSAEATTIRDPRAFLTTVVTRLCLDRLKAAQATREEYIGTWLPEPVLHPHAAAQPEDLAERGETLTMAMLVLLETLSPLERAVYVLREAFEYPYEEIGAILGRSAAACRQAHHRARAHVAEQRPRFQAGPEQQRRLVTRFIAAARQGDVAALTNMLSDDVTFWSDGGGVVTAARNPVSGADRVARLVSGLTSHALQSPDEVFSFTFEWINGEPGVLIWAGARLDNVIIIECDATRIGQIRAVRNPAKLAHLQARLAAPA